jgi:hypothetical protein
MNIVPDICTVDAIQKAPTLAEAVAILQQAKEDAVREVLNNNNHA